MILRQPRSRTYGYLDIALVVVLGIGMVVAALERASPQGDLHLLQLVFFAPILLLVSRVLPLGLVWFAVLGLGLSFVSMPRARTRGEVAISVAEGDRFGQRSAILRDSLEALLGSLYRQPEFSTPKFRVVHERVSSREEAERLFVRTRQTPLIVSPVGNGAELYLGGETEAALSRIVPALVEDPRLRQLADLFLVPVTGHMAVRAVHLVAAERFIATTLQGLLPRKFVGGVALFAMDPQAEQWLSFAASDVDHWLSGSHRGFVAFMLGNRRLIDGLTNQDRGALWCAVQAYLNALAFTPLREDAELRVAILNNLALTEVADGLLAGDVSLVMRGYGRLTEVLRHSRGTAQSPIRAPMVAKVNSMMLRSIFRLEIRRTKKQRRLALKKEAKAHGKRRGIKKAAQRGAPPHPVHKLAGPL